MMINAIQIALSGLHTASKKAEEAAGNIASTTLSATPSEAQTVIPPLARTYVSDEINLAEEFVNLTTASFAYEASLKTIEIASSMQDELLKSFDRKL